MIGGVIGADHVKSHSIIQDVSIRASSSAVYKAYVGGMHLFFLKLLQLGTNINYMRICIM